MQIVFECVSPPRNRPERCSVWLKIPYHGQLWNVYILIMMNYLLVFLNSKGKRVNENYHHSIRAPEFIMQTAFIRKRLRCTYGRNVV